MCHVCNKIDFSTFLHFTTWFQHQARRLPLKTHILNNETTKFYRSSLQNQRCIRIQPLCSFGTKIRIYQITVPTKDVLESLRLCYLFFRLSWHSLSTNFSCFLELKVETTNVQNELLTNVKTKKSTLGFLGVSVCNKIGMSILVTPIGTMYTRYAFQI